MKLWATIEGGVIKTLDSLPSRLSAYGLRRSDGHMAAVFVTFKRNLRWRQSWTAGRTSQGARRNLSPLRTETVPPLFCGGRQATDKTGPHAGKRNGRLAGTAPPRHAVRLQICLPEPQYATRRRRRSRAPGELRAPKGIYRINKRNYYEGTILPVRLLQSSPRSERQAGFRKAWAN